MKEKIIRKFKYHLNGLFLVIGYGEIFDDVGQNDQKDEKKRKES